MFKFETKTSRFCLALLGSLTMCLWLGLTTRVFWVDKMSTVISLIESLKHRPFSIVGVSIPCIDSTGASRVLSTWAEEPPIYHLIAFSLSQLGITKFYSIVTSLLSYELAAWGLYFLTLNCSVQESRKTQLEDRVSLSLLSHLLPALTLHAIQPLPDLLSLATLIWFLYFAVSRKWKIATVFAVVSVTTKALSFFALCAFVGSFICFVSPRKMRTNVGLILMALISILPMLLWLWFLKFNHVSNPFFNQTFGLGNHTGGLDFSILFTGRYIWRWFLWNIYQGVSVPLFISGLFAIRNALKARQHSLPYHWRMVFLGYATSSIGYWIVVRGPQFTAPWYSFPFLPAFFVLGGLGFLDLRSKRLRYLLLLTVAIFGIVDPGINLNISEMLNFDAASRPITLACPKP